ncbi:hypothetical protein BDR06DRAFT_913424, partial [Suillus hirtellus]
IKLAATFPKKLTSLLTNLCTQHVPLNKHLHRISKSKTPFCPHCPQSEETVHHYIIDCPHYRRERHALSAAVGRKASSLPYLLSKEEAIPHLIRYVNSTKRLKDTFGEIPISKKHKN